MFLRNWRATARFEQRGKKMARKEGSQVLNHQHIFILPREGPGAQKGAFPGGHPSYPPFLPQ